MRAATGAVACARSSTIIRRSSPRRRWAGLTVTSLIMWTGTSPAPALIVLVHELKVATGRGPAPKVPSGSQAPAIRIESARAVSRQISRALSDGRPSWKPRLTAPIHASTAALASSPSSCGSGSCARTPRTSR